MTTLILILQTFTGALAYEYGPYPSVEICEEKSIEHIQALEASHNVLKIVSDCRLIYPELQEKPPVIVADTAE